MEERNRQLRYRHGSAFARQLLMTGKFGMLVALRAMQQALASAGRV